MANITKKIPFSFCRINRAAEFLEMKTEDLLSLSVSGKIILCVRLDGFKSVLFINDNANNLDRWYHSLEGNNTVRARAKNISNHSLFSIDNMSIGENNEPFLHPKFYPIREGNNINENISQSHDGRAFGLWIPQETIINSVLNYGYATMGNESIGLYRTDDNTPDCCLIPLTDDESNDMDDEEGQLRTFKITTDDLWITADQVRKLVEHDCDYNDLPCLWDRDKEYITDFMKKESHFNHMAEHHAKNRERLFKSAIYLLSKYPDKCRGERKEISPEKWKDCILDHKGEIPPLTINNEDVILRHLRSATNGKV
ncbi:hypothetical protein [Pectobacterium sp. LFLA-215]|uniref:hypothetical protein n=1 Tax=Pectobacterium sp. LFLA-215 TaxID=3419008 RepID=UPI003F5BAF39